MSTAMTSPLEHLKQVRARASAWVASHQRDCRPIPRYALLVELDHRDAVVWDEYSCSSGYEDEFAEAMVRVAVFDAQGRAAKQVTYALMNKDLGRRCSFTLFEPYMAYGASL